MKVIQFISGIVLFSLFSTKIIVASELIIENVRPVFQAELQRERPSVILDLSWNNAWHNQKNHDAAWVFFKFSGAWNNHVKLVPTGHLILTHFGSRTNMSFQTSPDSLGIMIFPASTYRGNIHCRIQIYIDTTSQKINNQKMNELSAHGVEMVYIPQGSFTLGSPDGAAIEKASFYKSDASGNPDGLYRISSEDKIPVGAQVGNLFYWSESDLYNGDRKGPVPAKFPKGFRSFYVMKYELTQGQYADFLNKIYISDTYIRSPIGGKDYYKKRGSIYFKDGKYQVKDKYRPMNFISWEDAVAYTDWAALRPITELEYTKAARGPEAPIPFQMVWGTDNMHELVRHNKPDGSLTLDHGLDEGDLNDMNRAKYGASYYWVMDLSGSVWEKVITIGNPLGREFIGEHGDGLIRFGKANVANWPLSDDEEGGYGYRGGGYYESTIIGEFNPHAPIGYRYYGAWSGGPKSVAYGYRAGRSAW